MPISVFLADDHAIVRDGLKYLLEAQSDIRVIGVAWNGRVAVEQVQRLKPDVIVIDIAMPELNGIDAAQQIRRNNPATRIIILSIHSSSEHIYRAFQAGASGYLLKESAGVEVADAIRAVMTGRRYLSQPIADTVLDEYLRGYISAKAGPLAKLSEREREILQLIVEGKSNAAIADLLALSLKTVETYRSRMMKKLGVTDLPSLVKFAIQHGITQVE